MNYIIKAFMSCADIPDEAVKVTPKKKPLTEAMQGNYYLVSDGKNPNRSTIYAEEEITSEDDLISKLEANKEGKGYWELLHYINGNPKKLWDTDNGKVSECKEEVCKEDRTVDLHPQFDSRQSFYGKARVFEKDDGSKILYSYGTPVCKITKDGKAILLRRGYLGWSSSQTTLRHVKDFLKQNGFEAGSLKDLAKKYPTQDADAMDEDYDDLEDSWDGICGDIITKVKDVLGIDITDSDIHFDDSRAWSLYIPGSKLGLPVNKFGAYRNYLGGGVRGGIEHNGREQDNTLELGKFFAEQLARVEDLINAGFEDDEDWDKPTGVLHENNEVNLNKKDEVEDAVKEIEKDEHEEPTEKIIDADADTIDKVKDSYLGDAVLICTECRRPRFMKPELLKKDESSGLYNLDDECPNCGSIKGYELGGQIGKLDAGESEEDKVDVDVKVDEKPAEEKKLQPIDIDVEEKPLDTVESIDDTSFNKLITEYLKTVYSNVESFTTTDAQLIDESLEMTGTVNYTSGKSKDIKFIFNNMNLTKTNKIKMTGMNESLTNCENAYSIIACVKNNCLNFDTISYNYEVKLNESEKIVRGRQTLKESK